MEHIAKALKEREKSIILHTKDPVVREGFVQLPNFILKHKTLSVGSKISYAILLSYAWHNDYCFPGQKRMAEDMGVSVGSVNKYLQELESQGMIKITRRGLGKPNIYEVFFRVKKQS